jgi:hypothetical protein
MKKLSAAIALTLLSAGSQALTVSYSDFSDLSDFQLNGSTAAIANPTTPDNALRLTDNLSQGGSAFLTNAISLNNQASFSARFDFRISNPMGISDNDGQGADGLVFVVQTVSNTAGGIGGGIGYSGLADSVGIEFDTWNNGSWDDNNGNHVGINLEGNIDSVVQTSVSPRMNNGGIWTAWVDYNGATDLLEVRLSDSGLRSAIALLSLTVDLETVLGSPDAFVGFTSGTGAGGGFHDILNFEFRDDFNPITVSEPAPFALLGLGLLGFLAGRRRKA